MSFDSISLRNDLRSDSVPPSPRNNSPSPRLRVNSVPPPNSPRDRVLGSNIYHDTTSLVQLHVEAENPQQAALVNILVAERMSSVVALRYGTQLVQQRVPSFDAVDFAQRVVDLSSGLDEDQALRVRKGLILTAVVIEAEECDVSSDNNVLFRDETFPCRIVKACLMNEGKAELKAIKRACFRSLSKACRKNQVKKFWRNSVEKGLQAESPMDLNEETVRTHYTVAAVIDAISEKVHDSPKLKEMFTILRSATESALPKQGGKALAPKMVSSFLFLRYLSPWLTQLNSKDPWVKKLKGKDHKKQVLEYARVVGKVLQQHANGTVWEGEKRVFNKNQALFDLLVDSLSLKEVKESAKPTAASNNNNEN